ncbi:hypothetical protein [Haloterrigena salinisoli]|uniref:DUF7382 domain-containing protein n=1 Tax=Haloterrigena salinisoli TaxID=3132747 RepID=UPI0030CE2008
MVSDQSAADAADRTHRSRLSFGGDDRAIEGLPIRLVIALVVGVAALALMLNMLGGIGDVGDTEVSVEIEDELVEADAGGTDGEVKVSVIDENGNNVENARVIATAGSAQLDGVVEAETGDGAGLEDHEALLEFDGDQSLRADQDIGTLELEVIPPSDSNYIDEQPNPEIRVASDF